MNKTEKQLEWEKGMRSGVKMTKNKYEESKEYRIGVLFVEFISIINENNV